MKFESDKLDEVVKSRNPINFVIPAKAGIQLFQGVLDPGLRRGDDPIDFLRDHHFLKIENFPENGNEIPYPCNFLPLRKFFEKNMKVCRAFLLFQFVISQRWRAAFMVFLFPASLSGLSMQRWMMDDEKGPPPGKLIDLFQKTYV